MTALAPHSAPPSPLPLAKPATTWRDAALLLLALVAFVWVSDVQGVIFHRDEFRTWAHWVQPGLTYLFVAGVALWQWDWVVRVARSLRFWVLAALATGVIAWASTHRAPPPDAGVPVLRAGERERRNLVLHAVAPAVTADWILPATSHADMSEEQDKASPGFTYELPAGWSELPTSNMRLVNLRVAGDAQTECYLSSLPGDAGGVLDNVNRWRQQMELAPLDAEALAKLPRGKLLGRDAVLVELDGKFTGMGGTSIDNARMVGAVAVMPATMLFLKMTGPRDVVQRERAGFDKVLATLAMAGGAHGKKDAKAPARAAEREAPATTPPTSGEGLRWTVPDAWQAGPERMMRVVTLNPKTAPDVECYVSVLPGAAGGVLDNVNRWRSQFGLDAVQQADVDAWTPVPVLGKQARLVEAEGTFTGMSGGAKPDQALLGTVVPLADRVMFVKMTGPKAQVQAERARFFEFCRSIQAQ